MDDGDRAAHGWPNRRATRTACAAAVAVGAVLVTSLIAAAAGTSWTIVNSPNGSTAGGSSRQGNDLNSVACPSVDNCWAVGTFGSGTVTDTLIERNTGSGWAIAASSIESSSTMELRGISCTSAAACWAVGSRDGHAMALSSSGGSLSVATVPDAPGGGSHTLLSVSCVGANACWAAGTYNDANGKAWALLDKYDGTSWSVDPGAQPPSQGTILRGVTCLTTSDCWAVGYYFVNSTQSQALTEHYDGTRWSVVSSPDVSGAGTDLTSVTCVTATECWAVGARAAGRNATDGLIERFDGTTWSVVSSPSYANGDSIDLTGVACVSQTDCWTVGSHNAVNGPETTLVEHFEGSAWTFAGSENTGTNPTDNLRGVACDGAGTCSAVGWSIVGQDSYTLIETNAQPAANVPETPAGPWSVAGAAAALLTMMVVRSLARRRSVAHVDVPGAKR